MRRAKKILFYNLIVIIVAIQVVALLNYWFLIYRNIVEASINDTIVYQGKVVTSSTSVAIDDGEYNMRFVVYDAETSGNALWTEVWDGTNQGVDSAQVTITDGFFTVELNALCGSWTGGSCASNGGVDFNTSSLFLQVEMDVDGNDAYEEIFTPRKQFSATAYAMNTDTLDGYDVGTFGDAIPLLSADNIWSGVNTIAISSAVNKGLVIQGASSQSANLVEFQTSSGSVVTAINESGVLETSNIYTPKITTTTTGVGTAPSDQDVSIVSYHTFDNVLTDSVNSNDGTFVGDAAYATGGVFNYTGDNSITLDGVGDYVSVPDNNAYDVGTGNFTAMFWIKPTTGTGSTNQYAIGKNPSTGGAGWWFRYNEAISNYAYFWTHSSGTTNYRDARVTTDNYLVDGNWHHVALVRKGTATSGDMLIYIDGVQRASSWAGVGGAPDVSNTEPLLIGAAKESGSTQDMVGNIDNVIFYNEDLTAEEIQAHYEASLNSGAGFIVDTGAQFSGTELFAIKNNGTTQAYFDADGDLVGPGVTTTGQTIMTPSTDVVPLTITASSSQTANLTEWKNNAGSTVAYVDPSGNLIVQDITAQEIITSQITTTATGTASAPSENDANIMSYWKMDDNGIFPEDTTDANLVTWYKFEDGSGTTVTDEQGNYNATLSGSYLWNSTGAFNESTDSVNFSEGSPNAQANIGNVTELSGADQASFSFWFQYDTIDNGVIVSKYSNSSNNFYIQPAHNDGNTYVYISNGGQQGGRTWNYGGVFTAGNWYYMTVVYDGTQATNADRVKIYYNEINVGTSGTSGGAGFPTTLSSTTTDWLIGNYAAGTTNGWNGSIDNFAIYDRAVTYEEHLRNYRKMQTTYIADYVGANHGAITGATFMTPNNGAFGYTGDDALDFDGTDDYATIADDASIDLERTDAFSIYAWVKPATSKNQSIVAKRDSAANAYRGYEFWLRSDNKLSMILNGNSGNLIYVHSNETVTNGDQNFVVMTYDGSSTAAGVKLYIDGVLQSNTINNNNLSTTIVNNIPLRIGTREQGDLDFDGSIDNVILYDDVRTDEEIASDYALFAGGSGVGNIIDTQNAFASESSKLVSIRNAGDERLYIGLNVIGFNGEADKTLKIERTQTAATAGYDLTLQAGGAVSGGTNLLGGDLYITGGVGTGTGGSNIYLQTSGGGSSGTDDVTPTTKLTIAADGSVQIASGGELRFYNGANYVGFKAPTSISGDQVWELPDGDGATGQVFVTDGAGVLSWEGRLDMMRVAASSSTYSASSDDQYIGSTYSVTGTQTITLPTPTAGKVLIIKDEDGNAGTNPITIDNNSTENIDGSTSVSISTNYGSLRLYSDGTDWFTY
jgi:hypothetical protein